MEGEQVPSESQTIAAKRSVRLADKINRTRRVAFERAWWAGAGVEAAGLAVMCGVNLAMIWPMLGSQVPPTQFSGPVVPIAAKALVGGGLPFGAAVQVVNVLAYLALPVGIYLFIKQVSGRKLPAFLAMLAVSLPWGMFAEARVYGSFLGSDTPHVVSLALIPWVIFALLIFLRSGGWLNLVVSATLVAVITLVSPSGLMSWLVFSVITVFSEMLLGNGRLKLVRFLTVVGFGAGLNSFWYNPPFAYWLVSGSMGSEMREILGKIVPLSLFGVPILSAFGFLLFDRKPNLQAMFLAFFYSIVFAGVVVAGGGGLTGHTAKFLPELGMAVAFLIGVVVVKASEMVRYRLVQVERNLRWGLAYGGVACVLAVLVGGLWVGRERFYYEEEQVLGIWTQVDKDELWQMRDHFSRSPLAWMGNIVTGLTVVAMGGLGLAIKKDQR